MQHLHEIGDLVDMATIRRWPGAPLIAVNRAEIALLVGPLIPDRNTVFLEIGNIGIALQKPQQLIDDRAQMQLLGGQDRKALPQIEAHLIAENRARARSRAVAAIGAVVEHMLEKIEIGAHGMFPDRVFRDRFVSTLL